MLKWLQQEGIETAPIEPSKPWQNGTTESLNGKPRDDCLSMEWFRSRAEARVIIESWRRHYSEDRPHSRLGYRPPKQFKDEQKQQTEAATQRASLNQSVALKTPAGHNQGKEEEQHEQNS